MEEKLFDCLEKGNIEELKTCLKRGCNPNIVKEGKYTPLLLAIASNNYDMVKLLLNNGANPNIIIKFNYLDIAETLCDTRIVDLLKNAIDENDPNKIFEAQYSTQKHPYPYCQIRKMWNTYSFRENLKGYHREDKLIIYSNDGYVAVGCDTKYSRIDEWPYEKTEDETAFIKKIDHNGYEKWSDYSNSECYNYVIEHNGEYIVVGVKRGYSYGAIMKKYNSNGKIIWEKRLNNTISNFWNIIAVYDGYVVIGNCNSIFGKKISEILKEREKRKISYNNLITVKYDFDGNIMWKKEFKENSSVSSVKSTKKVSDGYISVGCSGSDAVLIKYDLNGNCVWYKKFDNPCDSNHNSKFESAIEVTDGYILVGTKAIGKNRIDYGVIIKYDFDGNIIWEKHFDWYEHFDSKREFLSVIKINNKILAFGNNGSEWGQFVISYDFDGNIIESKNIERKYLDY